MNEHETVAIASPAAGRYYVMVRAYQAYSGVTLTVSYEPLAAALPHSRAARRHFPTATSGG